jgi:hypothetical protein
MDQSPTNDWNVGFRGMSDQNLQFLDGNQIMGFHGIQVCKPTKIGLLEMHSLRKTLKA